jgi:hypothetical protein
MIENNAYYSSEKVMDIINTILKHRRLEEKLGIIIKGEKFKVLLFLLLLPLIIGAIGGMFPLIYLMTNYGYNSSNSNYINLINFFDLLIIFLTLLICNTITSYYFLKVVNYEKNYFIIFISNMLFILSFFISFNNILVIL